MKLSSISRALQLAKDMTSLNFYGTMDDDDILCGSTRKFGDKINYFESKLQ